ncbi:MAG: Holliday junction branch migration protein RuvA [Thermomicrobiales bacterium]
MIAGIRGQIVSKLADAVLVDVGGLIYRVGTTTTSLEVAGEVGETVRLHTYLLVREDQLALYGFASTEELIFFETLLGVSGVGPRLACAILSRFPAEQLQAAISAENVDLLSSVPGVGKRTASRLILDLRGKLPESGASTVTRPSPGDADVLAALRSLGYTNVEAHEAMARTKEHREESVEERVLAALRELAEA